MSRRTEITLLVLIFAMALVLRTYDLRGVPPGAQHTVHKLYVSSR